jgi:hypothetical protein
VLQSHYDAYQSFTGPLGSSSYTWIAAAPDPGSDLFRTSFPPIDGTDVVLAVKKLAAAIDEWSGKTSSKLIFSMPLLSA